MKNLLTTLIFSFILVFSTKTFSQTFDYLSPKSNSTLVSLNANIILKSSTDVDYASLSSNGFTIVGSISGEHKGTVKLADDKKTILFLPTIPFSPNEIVEVNVSEVIKTTDGAALPSVVIYFKTTPLVQPLNPNNYIESENSLIESNLITNNKISYTNDTLPSNFPVITVNNLNDPAPGDIFMTNQLASNLNASIGNFLMILNNDGSVAKSKELPSPANIFKMQPNGELSYSLRTAIGWTLLDTSLAPVDSFYCGNGYTADIHDFYLLPNGHALLFAYDPQPVDMSEVISGGNPDAIVTGAVIQEIDANKDVVFQWRSWDYIQFTDSYSNLTAPNIDLVHINSIRADNDGNIVVSMRHLSNIIKINRETGDIMWILGGKQNEFTFINEHSENAPTYFSYQHDASILTNGNITLFDNGNQHPAQYSRGVEYSLDLQNKTATLVWEYRHDPDIFSRAMGTLERLPNGNTIVGWGIANGSGIPTFTEVHPDNSVALEMSLPDGQISHRSYKYAWASQKPEVSVTKEILPLNTYEFNSNTDTTGITITFSQLNSGGEYTFATALRYNYAPINPTFITTAPLMVSNYFKIEGMGIISYTGDVVVNLSYYPAVLDPKKTIIYSRPNSNTTFTALPTSYDSTKNELTFTTTNLGDFAFGIPQTVDSAYAPMQISPKDGQFVNGEDSVKLVWGTKGIVSTYHLQVAMDSLFNNIVTDNSDLTSTLCNINSLSNDTTYYWRLNNTNSSGTSNWSEVQKFNTASPFIKIISPAADAQLYIDSTYVVRWESNVNDTVDIQLLLDNSVVSIIGDSVVSGTQAVLWKVPSGLQTDSSYKIKVSSISNNTLSGISVSTFMILSSISEISDENDVVGSYTLSQNFPNPFNPSTVINYSLANYSKVRVDIYNVIGQRIATLVNSFQQRGNYSVTWTAEQYASGIYFYSINAVSSTENNFYDVKKMILIK